RPSMAPSRPLPSSATDPASRPAVVVAAPSKHSQASEKLANLRARRAPCSHSLLPRLMPTATEGSSAMGDVSAKRFASADDRGACVLVNAVGLAKLVINQTSRGKRAAELSLRESSGDAPGPRGHVGPRCIIHVGVGNHVGHGEPAAGL